MQSPRKIRKKNTEKQKKGAAVHSRRPKKVPCSHTRRDSTPVLLVELRQTELTPLNNTSTFTQYYSSSTTTALQETAALYRCSSTAAQQCSGTKNKHMDVRVG